MRFNKKYLGHEDYDPNAASLGKSFYDNYLSLSAISNDKTHNGKPTPQPPSPHNLYCSLFRRSSDRAKTIPSFRTPASKRHT